MHVQPILSTAPCRGLVSHNRCSVAAALLQPLHHLHSRQHSFHTHASDVLSTSRSTDVREQHSRHRAHAATSRHGSTAGGDVVDAIQSSLDHLQQLAANLNSDPSTDGILSAYQQLCHIQKQVLQEQRTHQARIARSKWRSSCRATKGSWSQPASPTSTAGQLSDSDDEYGHESFRKSNSQQGPSITGVAEQDGSDSRAVAELQELKQLRQKCDDAQDFLVGLIQAQLQDEPPTAATRLLTAAAYRQLNVAAINRTCINTFLEKQGDAAPSDMAALMTALALVRCSGKASHQVEGLGRSQLAALFGGTMTHLIAYVERALQGSSKQVQQLQQQEVHACSSNSRSSIRSSSRSAGARGRRRRTAPAAGGSAVQQLSATGQIGVVDQEELQRLVAAGVAAHVSGRVPLNSALIPHILQLLGDQAPAWLHPITELQSATSVGELHSMISTPSRYDYTYLAAALHKLSELVEQQQVTAVVQDVEAIAAMVTSEFAQASRLARKLYGRLQQLQEDATAAEIVCVLAAAAKMGVSDGKVYATSAMQLVDGVQLEQATDAQVASVMYAVAWYCSNTGGGDGSFGRQQQQHILKQCLHRMTVLLKQQQQPAAASSASAAAAAASDAVTPANALMALWAVATSGLQLPTVLVNRLLAFLAEPSTIHSLLGGIDSSSSARGQAQQQQQQQQLVLQQAARNSCTVVWAAAQLQQLRVDQTQHMPMIQMYLQGFLRALRLTSVSCNSITSVLQSVATLLAAQQQQSSEGNISSTGADQWRSVFLRCSDEVVQRIQQQQSAAATGQAATEDMCSVTAACQVVWAHQVSGITFPDSQLMALLTAFNNQAPAWLLEAAISRTTNIAGILDLIQSPAAANADLACIAAAFKRLVELGAQHAAVVAQTAAAEAEWQGSDQKMFDQQVKECLRQLSAFAQAAGVPDTQQSASLLQRQQEDVANQEQGQSKPQQPWCPTAAAVAAAAATVLWATAQLQHRDPRLCSSCLQLFHLTAASATTGPAAAVVNAMAEAGRKLRVIYKDEGLKRLQEVLQICTAKLLAAPLAVHAEHTAQQQGGSEDRRKASNKNSKRRLHQQQEDVVHAYFCSGEPQDVLTAQNILQLHAVLDMQPPQQQLHVLLAAATDEAALAGLKAKAAVAALVAVLSAVAELSQLPASQQNGLQQKMGPQSTTQAAAAALYEQQLLQDLLMYGLLPRIASATPKQIAASLEAVTELAVGQQVAAPDGAVPTLELSLARDYVRAVFGELLAPADVAGNDDAVASSSSSKEDFLTGWKGEHIASVAVSALRLGVACPEFFAAVERDLLVGTAPADQTAAATGTAEQPQQQRKKSRVQNVQLEHLVTICCSAAALQCRVPQLLAHAMQSAQPHLAEAATSARHDQQQKQKNAQKKQQQQQVDPAQVMQLAWCAAVMDVSQLLLQAKQLVAAVAEAVSIAAAPVARKTLSGTASARAAATAKVPDPVLFGFNGLAARMFQLHVWLADRQVQAAQLSQQQEQWLGGGVATVTVPSAVDTKFDHSSTVAGTTIPAAEAEFGLGLGLSDVITHEQLQKAGQQWSQMQVAAAAAGEGQRLVVGDWRLAAVAEVLQELPGVEELSAVTATADGWIRLDLEARARGVPVAVLLLNDPDEEYIMGGGSYAARHLVPQKEQQTQVGPAAAEEARQAGKIALKRRSQQQQPRVAAPNARVANNSTGNSSSSSCSRPLSSSGLLQECLAYQHVGDIMFRARALAARGYWVAVVSWREWSSLDGVRDAELAYLQEKLWLLLQDNVHSHDVNSHATDSHGQQSVSVSMPAAAAMLVQREASWGEHGLRL